VDLVVDDFDGLRANVVDSQSTLPSLVDVELESFKSTEPRDGWVDGNGVDSQGGI
jgi:hypothetical protein